MGTPSAITNQRDIQACSMAGLPIMKGKETELLKIRVALIANSDEADRAIDVADLNRTVLFGLQLVKASCDAAVGIAGAVAEPAKAVSVAYSGAMPLAEALGKTIAGSPVSGADWAKAATAGANAAVKNSKLGTNTKDVVELHKIKSDIVIDATNSDLTKIKSDMIAYGVKLGKMTATALKNKTVGKIYDVAKEILRAGNAYVSAYGEYKGNDMSHSMESAKRIFRAHQGSVERQLLVLQKAILDCEVQLYKEGKYKPNFARPDPMDMLRNFQPSFPTLRPGR